MIGLGSLTAQSFVKYYNSAIEEKKIFSSADTLKILAVLVDFQEDKYDATIGTGKFGSHYTKAYGDTILDPLPHDANYFSDHLLFAKNYFQKVSRGKINISYKVLPEIITVTKYMRDYVPGYQSKDLTPLGNFAKEVWELADNKFTNIKFSDYNLFVIFNAGVSSGLDYGTFSVSRNMPALYLGLNSFKDIFGNQFSGFSTKSGKIINTIILPETETREISGFNNSTFLNEATINGEIVANIGSYLGLPDLFNTDTGLSAIGRFGLIDGQAIGANYGMFPPEPSAWEKIYMGWDDSKLIGNNLKPNIVTRKTAAIQDTVILKIPINSSEYFLVENRQQDALNDKLKITYKRSGQVLTKIVEKDTSGLFNVNYNSIPGGVVIDVDEYDAAVPGNGLIIWHIDEKIISQNISTNSINNSKNKGVYVEEADGIQDIGIEFESVLGKSIGEGTKEDFWYLGNKAKLYKNQFSSESKPNTNSNNNAKSLITLDQFSPISNKMSFKISYGNDKIKLTSSFDLPVQSLNNSSNIKLIILQGINTLEYFFLYGSYLLKTSSDGKLLFKFDNFGNNSLLSGIMLNGKQYVVSAYTDKLNIYSKDITSGAALDKVISIQMQSKITSNLVITKKIGVLYLTFGTEDGNLIEAEIDKLLQTGKVPIESIKKVSNSAVTQIARPFDDSDGYYSFISNKTFYDSKGNQNQYNVPIIQNILIKNSKNEYLNFVTRAGISPSIFIDIIMNGKVSSTCNIYNALSADKFSISDLYNNGKLYFVNSNYIGVFAYDLNSNQAENFPIKLVNDEFSGQSILLDVDRDGLNEIINVTQQGKLYVFDTKTGRTLNNFPLVTGNFPINSPFLFSEELPTMGPLPVYKPYVATIDANKHLTVWNLAPVQGKVSWNGEYGNATQNSFLALTKSLQADAEYFPLDKTYNWPNPVYSGSTNIRYYVSEDSDIKIKIVDLAGDLVSELNNKARGGFDNETAWDVSKIQSGVYFAYVEAKSVNGKSASKVIKIAVIK